MARERRPKPAVAATSVGAGRRRCARRLALRPLLVCASVRGSTKCAALVELFAPDYRREVRQAGALGRES